MNTHFTNTGLHPSAVCKNLLQGMKVTVPSSYHSVPKPTITLVDLNNDPNNVYHKKVCQTKTFMEVFRYLCTKYPDFTMKHLMHYSGLNYHALMTQAKKDRFSRGWVYKLFCAGILTLAEILKFEDATTYDEDAPETYTKDDFELMKKGYFTHLSSRPAFLDLPKIKLPDVSYKIFPNTYTKREKMEVSTTPDFNFLDCGDSTPKRVPTRTNVAPKMETRYLIYDEGNLVGICSSQERADVVAQFLVLYEGNVEEITTLVDINE